MGDALTVGVAVTGLGATTPLGGDVGSTWGGMLEGRSGIAMIEEEWAEGLPVRMAGQMRVDPAEVLGRVQARRLDRCQQAALVAAREAWADAGAPEVESERLAVVIGTGVGGMLTSLAMNELLGVAGARKLSPYTVPMLMPNGSAAVVSIEFGARAGAHTPVSACASGAEAIAMGLDLIRLGRADVVIAGGGEACVHPLALASAGLEPIDIGHVNAHATSTPTGDVTEAASITMALGTHPVVTATKSMTGHLCGASGSMGAIGAILALRDGVVPATRNLDD